MRHLVSSRLLRYALVGALGISIGSAGGILSAGLIPSADGTIKGCYHSTTGHLRVVTNFSECTKTELPISWNQRGLQGLAGPTGATGAPGATG
ncbi:MAG TPA: hypothetical protein VKE23_09330, partial [Candidatus Limnocylindria bacterium]|nr:hypothetical protein [Candidatus Limnocylindria bacterium]